MDRVLVRKLMLTMLVLGGLGIYIGAGTYAIFTAQTTNAGNAFQAGTVRMTNGQAGSAIFNVPALLPGESADQPVTIQNTGTLDFHYTMLVTAASSSLLDQDPINGLQFRVDRCVTGPWATPTPGTSTMTHVCTNPTPAATPATVTIYSGRAVHQIAGTPAPVAMGTPLPGGEAHYLNLTASLPSTALQTSLLGLTSTLDIRWRAEAQGATPTPGVTATPAAATATPTPTPTPGMSSAVTNLSVSAVPNTAGTTGAVHAFSFTTGRPLGSVDTIEITYPAGLDLTSLVSTQISIQPFSGAPFVQAAGVSVAGQVITVTWPAGVTAQSGDRVTVQLAGRTNPATASTFSVRTSQQTDLVSAVLAVSP